MSPESAKEFYDRQYALHKDRRIVCPNSLHDLQKAQRRVQGVARAFGLEQRLRGAKVLDVGCGLGYYTKALAVAGATVTGIDISKAGIEVARETFPECDFRCAAWPDDIDENDPFDVIWVMGLSLINTFDVQSIHDSFIAESLARLKPGGCIILGWGSNFSGQTIGNWSHWSIGMLSRMRELSGLSAPMVAEAAPSGMPVICSRLCSWAIIRAGYVLKKHVTFFMLRSKNGS